MSKRKRGAGAVLRLVVYPSPAMVEAERKIAEALAERSLLIPTLALVDVKVDGLTNDERDALAERHMLEIVELAKSAVEKSK